MEIRVLHKDNATLEDKTIDSNDYYSSAWTCDFVSAQDYLYIGCRFPFNHLYFKFGTANTAASALTVAVWDGDSWANVKETFDGTSSSSASFGQDGYIIWNPDKANLWGREDTQDSSGTELVTGLGGRQIYDHYWVRLAFDADFDAGTTVKWIGNLFSNDNDLGAEFPDLVRSETMNGWDDGGSKSNWEEQHVKAASAILKNLKKQKVIINRGQILDYHDFQDAAVSYVAMIAYGNMGPAFAEKSIQQMSKFEKRMIDAIGAAKIDKDLDGTIDREELRVRQGRLTRGHISQTRGKYRE